MTNPDVSKSLTRSAGADWLSRPDQCLWQTAALRLTTRQQRITTYLAEIDAAVAAATKGEAWLHRKIRGAPFSGQTPTEHMIAQGTNGAAGNMLRVLNLATMRAALARSETGRRPLRPGAH